MRPNQSGAILIFPITPTTTWLFGGYPYTTETRRAAKFSNKNFQLGTLSPHGINERHSVHSFIHKFMLPYFHQRQSSSTL